MVYWSLELTSSAPIPLRLDTCEAPVLVGRLTGAGRSHCVLRCLPRSAPSRPLAPRIAAVIAAISVARALGARDQAAVAVLRVGVVPGRRREGATGWRVDHDAILGQQNPSVKQNLQKMHKKLTNTLKRPSKLQNVQSY